MIKLKMKSLDNKDLYKIIKELNKESPWNHYFWLNEELQTIEKVANLKSEGSNLEKWNRINKIVEEKYFSNKSILDIGCSDGFFSYKVSNYAEEVLGIDLDPVRIKKANFIKSYFKLDNCNFLTQDICAIEDEKYDIGLILGLLHRLPDPLLFLKKVTNICDELIIEYKYYKSNKNIAYYGNAQKKSNDLNKLYFIFSPNCLENILSNFNFRIINAEKLKIFNKLKFPRHIIHAKKV